MMNELTNSNMTAGTVVTSLGELSKPINWDELFGRSAPVEIEIGIGSGYFISRYAADHPELNLFGLDKTGSEVIRTRDKCERIGATNVRLLRCDAVYFLDEYVASNTVNGFHVYYSDPWPKLRHHKRRLWRDEFVSQVSRTLRPGGLLRMKTDVTEYFEVIDSVIRKSGAFDLLEDRRLDQAGMPGDYETNFQRKAIEQGHPLHFQLWQRVPQ